MSETDFEIRTSEKKPLLQKNIRIHIYKFLTTPESQRTLTKPHRDKIILVFALVITTVILAAVLSVTLPLALGNGGLNMQDRNASLNTYDVKTTHDYNGAG